MLRYEVKLVQMGTGRKKSVLVSEELDKITCRGDAMRAATRTNPDWACQQILSLTEEMWNTLVYRALFEDFNIELAESYNPDYEADTEEYV